MSPTSAPVQPDEVAEADRQKDSSKSQAQDVVSPRAFVSQTHTPQLEPLPFAAVETIPLTVFHQA